MNLSSSAPADRIGELEAEAAGLREELARAQAECERLRESEKMYRFSAEIGGRLVWSTDPDGRVLAMSRLFSLVTGISDEQALREGWIERVHPEDRERVRALWADSLRTGAPFSAEFRAGLADGSYRTALSRAVAVRDPDGRILRWYGSSEDVQEERQAEQARREAEERLRESEERHRYTIELSQQIVWTAGPDGALETISPGFWELTGLEPGSPPRAAIHPDDLPQVALRWREAVERGQPHQAQYRLRMKDGSYRHFRVRAAPRRDEEGRIVRWYGAIEDVHLQQESDLARRELEERYRLALRATNDAVWDYDIVNGVVDWSDNAAAIIGKGKKPLGRTSIEWWEEHIHPDDRLSVAQSLAEAIEGDESRWSGTYRFLRDDGSYADMFDRGFIIRDAAGTAIRAVGAMADLTERHRAEAEIRRMQAELVHVSRLTAMGTMASTLAHELNQPLTAVTNYVRGARRLAENAAGGRDASLSNALESAETASLRAGEIVRRLRELVSRGTVSVKAERLPQLIEDAGVLGFVDESSLGIRHRLELDPAAEWVRADRVQIQQVLINLIRNAVEAMEDSPVREVVISTHALPDGMAEIRVADTGCGIAPEHLDSLFSQFMTTKSGGMGIGLPISRTIVEAHGGTITAEPRDGGGSVFCFTLPMSKQRR